MCSLPPTSNIINHRRGSAGGAPTAGSIMGGGGTGGNPLTAGGVGSGGSVSMRYQDINTTKYQEIKISKYRYFIISISCFEAIDLLSHIPNPNNITSYPYILSTHPLDTSYQPTFFSTHLPNPPYHQVPAIQFREIPRDRLRHE